MKASHTALASLLLAILMVIAAGVVATSSFRQIEQATEAQQHAVDVINDADALLSELKDAETGSRGYLLTGNESFLEDYLAVRDSVPRRLKTLRQITTIPSAQKHLAALAPLIDAKLKHISRGIELRRSQDIAGAIATVRSGEGKRLMDSIRSEMRAFVSIQQASLAQREANSKRKMRYLFNVVIATAALCLLFAIAFLYLNFQRSQQRLKNLVHLETLKLLETQEQTNSQLLEANLTLLTSEEKLAVTLNSIGDAVIATDPHACITLLNPIAEQLTGWTQAEASGRKIDEVFIIINKQTRHAATIPVNETLENGTIVGLANHTVLISKDGTERDIADSCAPIRDRDGRVLGAVLVFRDVTNNYAIEQALHDSSALVQTVLNTVADGIITLRARGGIVEKVNPAAELMFGYTAKEFFGKNIGVLVPELNHDQLNGSLEYYKASDEARASGLGREVNGRRKDGSIFPMEIAVSEMLLGGERYFTGILRDISVRKKAEIELLKAGALQSAIFNSANFSSIATDAKGVIQIFNVGAERMLGYTAAEVMNQITPADISDPHELVARAQTLSVELSRPITPGFEALVFKASRGIEDIYELTYIRKDGSRFPAVVSVTALRDEQEKIIGYLLIGTDNTARKQAEAALHKAGALQNAIFNSANFSSIATDAKGVIQIFNVGAEHMLGYSAAEVMNKITPADISDSAEVIARAEALSIELSTSIAPGFEALVFKASRGIEDIYELTYIRKDGSRFPAVVSVTALRDGQENIIGYLLIGTDNTARKQAEAALHKAGALQNAIFNSANFSSIATDAKGVIQIFNVGAERMLGYTAADVMNKITPADISDSEEVIARADVLSHELGTSITPGFEALVFKASRGIEDIYELTYIRKDGSRFPAVVSVTALRDEQENIIGYLLIGTDNTARKQIEAEQRKLDQRLRDQQFYTRSLIESNIDALTTTNPSGIITDVNKQMEVLTGCTRDELIGAPFKKFFTNEELADAGIKRALSENKITNYELTARAWDGKETVVSFNATTFYDRERTLQGVFAAARDITERKLLDHSLEETNIALVAAKSAAEKANLAKSDFLSNMSHELRTPLNAILGFAQLIDSGTPIPTPPQQRGIQQILQAGWYLLDLINEILDLALIESGKLSLSLEPVSFAKLIHECQDMIANQAQKRGISVIFPQFEAKHFVQADRTRLKQALINLLSNAMKYNKVNGTVEVSYQLTSPERIRICVKDSGQGLSPEKLSQLFQPFNRLGQESKDEEGTGIGLVVSKQLVELMGGIIGVESVVGEGSIFWIELNITVEAQLDISTIELKAIDSLEIQGEAAPYTLLYVEDNPANLLLIEELISRRLNIKLLTARDGHEGIEIARTALPDVILMDINLPGISGITAMKILADNAATADIPVIALSANAMPRDIEKGLEAGFFRYLTKPIKVDEFMVTLDEALLFSKSELVLTQDEKKLD